MGASQFCTDHGIAVIVDGREANAFAEATWVALAESAPQVMLTDRMAEASRQGASQVQAGQGVRQACATHR